MTTYIEYKLQDGSTVVLEAAEKMGAEQEGAYMPSAGVPGTIGGSYVSMPDDQKFDEAISSVGGSLNILLTGLQRLHEMPNEIEIKFGLTVTGKKSPLAFCRADTDANFEVTLKWKKPD
jgi:hypothetical protein